MATFSLGLSGVSDYSTAVPFLDLMKTSRPMWAMYAGNEWNQDNAALVSSGVLDADGWPTAFPATSTGIRTIWAFPTGTPGAEGPFALTYNGTGTIVFSGVTVTSSTAGRIEFSNADGGGFWFDITATDLSETGDYIRNIKIVPIAYEALETSGERFNPKWLDIIRDAAQLRFMDWMRTNGSTQSEWSDRPQVDDVTWSGQGVPVEIMVELANQTGTDPWFNMPHLATDEYIEEFATYVRDHLNPGLVATVEYSNETWNTLFPQTHWFKEQAETVWGVADGWASGYNLNYFAKRATEAALIWDEVFAGEAGSRVQNVMGVQTVPGVTWNLNNNLLNAGDWQSFEPGNYVQPASVFDAVAVTSYFGGSETTNSTLRGELLAYIAAHTTEDAYEWMKDNLLNPSYSGSIPEKTAIYEAIDAIVSGTYGLDLVLYEGGQHCHHSFGVGGLTTEQIDTITTFMSGFVRSRQMADLYAESWAAWAAIGDGPYMQFTEVGSPSQYGSWGLRNSLTDTNPRLAAVKSLSRGLPYQPGFVGVTANVSA